MPPFVLDMETGDPDDVFALALLATHPRSNLIAVTLYPGGPDQVGLVRHILDRLGKPNVPVGANHPKSGKQRVSKFYYNWLGRFGLVEPQGPTTEVIRNALRNFPDAHLVTGAALTNIAKASNELGPNFFREWTGQGGFAGDNIVPPEHRLAKFEGRVTCPTFNLSGDIKAAKELLCGGSFSPIDYRKLVPKNVCHGVFWDPEFNARIPNGAHPGLDLIKEGMSFYFTRHPNGKALHDVIAAVAALSPHIGTWAPVEPYYEKGEWGCRPVDMLVHSLTLDGADPVCIMTSLDKPNFEAALAS